MNAWTKVFPAFPVIVLSCDPEFYEGKRVGSHSELICLSNKYFNFQVSCVAMCYHQMSCQVWINME